MARPRLEGEPLSGSERTRRWRERKRSRRPPAGLNDRELAIWAKEHGRSAVVVRAALEDACVALDRVWALLLYGPDGVDETKLARDRLLEMKSEIRAIGRR
jgi:hypothetical protein